MRQFIYYNRVYIKDLSVWKIVRYVLRTRWYFFGKNRFKSKLFGFIETVGKYLRNMIIAHSQWAPRLVSLSITSTKNNYQFYWSRKTIHISLKDFLNLIIYWYIFKKHCKPPTQPDSNAYQRKNMCIFS